MSRTTLGRRAALSGGLAAMAAAAPDAGRCQDMDEADEDHAAFRAALLDWLREASERFALPVSADTAQPSRTTLRVQGVHPAISLEASGGFNAYVE